MDKNILGKVSYTLTAAHINELVRPECGAAVITPTGNIAELVAQLYKESREFKFTNSQAETTTGVVQNFSAFSNFKRRSIWKQLGSKISQSLRDGFEKLGQSSLFQKPLALDDLTLQYYPQSKPGDHYALSAHRDQSGFINLVVVLLIHGPSTFYICKDREGTTPIEPKEIPAVPGDLIVMRAGSFGDNLRRPCHYVGRIENPEGRLSFALRQLTDDKAKIQKLECFFGRKFGPGSKVPH